MTSPQFKMVKWYLDCVTDSGDAIILYCAELHWRGFHAAYSSVLSTQGQAVTARSSMSRYQLCVNQDRIEVELPRLKVVGEWKATSEAVQHKVFESPAGSVQWNCRQPGALARVQIGDRELSGLGYAECLTLTLPPWQLPMRQLRWGRFVSSTDTLVWIDWQGPYSTSLVIHNGRERTLHSVSDTELLLDGATLRMEEGLPLRVGRLGSTILPGVPALKKLLPRSLFNIEEHKWRSRGVFDTEQGQSHGWVIHEVVHWNL
jgi:hypothetical protein